MLRYNQFLLRKSNFAALESWRQQSCQRGVALSSSATFGEVHSRGGGSTEGKLKQNKKKGERKRKESGSILTRAGILEAVFEQGLECSARGRMSAGEERSTSTAEGMKGLEKQSGIKLCKICWVGSGLAQWAGERGLMRIHCATIKHRVRVRRLSTFLFV